VDNKDSTFFYLFILRDWGLQCIYAKHHSQQGSGVMVFNNISVIQRGQFYW